jgi:hypothetical protein
MYALSTRRDGKPVLSPYNGDYSTRKDWPITSISPACIPAVTGSEIAYRWQDAVQQQAGSFPGGLPSINTCSIPHRLTMVLNWCKIDQPIDRYL